MADARPGEVSFLGIGSTDGAATRAFFSGVFDGPRHDEAWRRGRIAHHEIPAQIRIVETLPMTVTGKIQKFVVRAAEPGPSAWSRRQLDLDA